jgi:hypothetical protein
LARKITGVQREINPARKGIAGSPGGTAGSIESGTIGSPRAKLLSQRLDFGSPSGTIGSLKRTSSVQSGIIGDLNGTGSIRRGTTGSPGGIAGV